MPEKTDLELTEQTVRELEAQVTEQRGIIEVLRRNGYTGGRPEALLETFKLELIAARKRLALIRGAP